MINVIPSFQSRKAQPRGWCKRGVLLNFFHAPANKQRTVKHRLMEKKTRGMPACYPAWPDSGWLAGLSSNTGTLSYFCPISTISFQLTVKEAVCGRRRRRLDKNFRFHCESLESVLPQPFVSSPVPCSSTQFLPVRHIALSRNNRNSATKTHQIRICTEPPGALSDERRY